MKDRETYDKYLDIPVSPEVREFLEENARELKRQRDQAYQYGVTCRAFDTEKPNNDDTDSMLCDMVLWFQLHNSGTIVSGPKDDT